MLRLLCYLPIKGTENDWLTGLALLNVQRNIKVQNVINDLVKKSRRLEFKMYEFVKKLI